MKKTKLSTAEEVLKSKFDAKLAIINNSDYTFNKVIEAMDEYAKQKSIDFIYWYELSGWVFNPSTGSCKKLKFYDAEEKSFEELYNEFDRDVSGL